jgi:predicted alpha/beta superfamily hydrolase
MAARRGRGWRRVRRDDGRIVYHVASARLEETLEITVVPPAGATREGRGLPVLYVLDPFLTLDIVVGWSRVYGRYSEGAIPPCFVVGVGYATDDHEAILARRIRDFTPTERTGSAWRPPLGAGRGPLLLAALSEEVIPLIEAEHRTSVRDRTLIGWSLGGLFALMALLQGPRTFSRYLVVSPSLWWDGRMAFEREKAWAATHDDLPARLFLAIGSEEQSPGGGWLSEGFSDEIITSLRMVSNFRAFARHLERRAYPGLRLDSVVFRDEHHMTVYPAAVARGLVRLFEE